MEENNARLRDPLKDLESKNGTSVGVAGTCECVALHDGEQTLFGEVVANPPRARRP